MLSDKAQKKKFKTVTSKNPEKYFATSILKNEGFSRKKCINCGIYFWSTTIGKVCGDAACSGGFRFIGKKKNDLDYIGVWQEFSKMFKKFGYTPINRYPVVSRWNPTTDFTNASIAAFQPFVVSGEVKPPANPLTIPQFCFRTVDIDNVGITGSHHTGFVMIGQHGFFEPREWNQDEYFTHIYQWLIKKLKIKKPDLTFHEDAWAGGGNFGACMEFFSGGVEIGNQVYMMHEQTASGSKDLDIKVLDMGMGQERCAWFSSGVNTIYDATFPFVTKKLFDKTGVNPGKTLMRKYIPYAGLLNVDEVDNIDTAWKRVAKKIDEPVDVLKKKILPTSGLYSVAEHARTLLVLLNDTALPSNTGGGYNLRVLIRRALSFIDRFNWNVDLQEVCDWHAKELRKQYPELKENLTDVHAILEVEENKYNNTRQRSKKIVGSLLKKKVTVRELLQVYDSYGVTPELLREEAEKSGKKLKVPDNFYAQVAELHEKQEQKHATKKEIVLSLKDLPETKALYYKDWKCTKFKAKVLKTEGKYVVLDQTYFYPTSGGQLHDLGTIKSAAVQDVFKQGNVIVHVIKTPNDIAEGKSVACTIDFNRRMQLAQHHTSTHIVNAAARKVLGKHANQSGAFKDVDKARIDITHYSAVSEAELKRIEQEANKIIQKKIPIQKSFMNRDEAEKQFGLLIYQGGVPIGDQLRIVNIVGVDVEACGGTHLDNTIEAGVIKMLKSSKISDSIVRLEFVAGNAAYQATDKEKVLLDEVVRLLGVKKELVPGRAKELFGLWKEVVKKKRDKRIEFKSKELFEASDKEILEETARILKTQIEHVPRTITRFLKELKK